MAGLNYETENSQKIIKQILAFLLGRPREGATLRQIKEMLGVSHGTAHRFVNHLTEFNKIHISVEAKATQAGHTAARYRLGRRIVTMLIPGMKYPDLPLNFFGPKTMNTDTPGEAIPQEIATPLMTDYTNALGFHPGHVGPYECKMIGAFDDGSGVTHMRWWDGQFWSYPLQPDHEDLDGLYIKPEETYFVRDDVDDYLARFAWRGFIEDQDPL